MSVIFVLVFLISQATVNEGCIQSEGQALSIFRNDLIDHANRLSTWSLDVDCCRWGGVVCDNVTGHVLELHLGNPYNYGGGDAEFEAIERSKLRGKINPSLLELKHLSYLDLSNNAFGGISIPRFLGSVESLRYLSLSNAGFGGSVPRQLGNLSGLQYLDLHTDYAGDLYDANLQWLLGLSLLEHLDLTGVNLNVASNWFQVLNTLPSLKNLYLSSCQLPQVPPPIYSNLSSLSTLDLSANSFDNPLSFSWIFHLTNLVSLDMSENDFEGCIFEGLENMTSLRHLDLSYNFFNSSIPDWLCNLNSLKFLNLGSNNLHGEISSAIGNMTSAVSLDFSGNHDLQGRIPRSVGNLCNLKSLLFSGVNLSQDVSVILEIWSGCVSQQLDSLDLSRCQLFGQLTNQLGNFKVLKELYLSDNSLSGPIPPSMVELSSLRVLEIDLNKLEGQFPDSFGQLANLEVLDLSNNLLAGVVSEKYFGNLRKLKIFNASNNPLSLKIHPDWVPPCDLETLGLRSVNVGSEFPSWLHSQKRLVYLDISNSGISYSIPSWLWNFQFQYLNLSHNQIRGQIPNIPRAAVAGSIIDLSFNQFSGQLPQVSSNVSVLDLSNNSFSGPLSPLLCYNLKETMGTVFLNLGGNSLSGEIPDCWTNWQNLVILKLDNNRLTGSVPSSMGTLHSLLSLHLQKNHLSGELPLSLKNCRNLVLLDVGDNDLQGNIPKWIGESLQKLVVLRLRSNKFSGYIPYQLCAIGSLQILDLADNQLHGSLPRCVGNISAMIKTNGAVKIDVSFVIDSGSFVESIMMKGQMLEYSTTLNLVRSIDFSSNKLSGEIPIAVTSLLQLQSLNLSHNFLTGKIPKRIGEMRSLESVDFSVNNLSGSIPVSMSNLTFLNHLNLSYNKLTGEIPPSTQLESFDPSSYDGNQLCGLPLQKCSANGTVFRKVGNGDGDNGNGIETDWFWLGLLTGFVISFWGVFGPLVIDKRWRSMYTLSSSQTNEEHQ